MRRILLTASLLFACSLSAILASGMAQPEFPPEEQSVLDAVPLMKAEGVDYSREIVRENPIPYKVAGSTVKIADHPWLGSRNFKTELATYSAAMAQLVAHRQKMIAANGDIPINAPMGFGPARMEGGWAVKGAKNVLMTFLLLRAHKVWYFKIMDDPLNKLPHTHHATEELVINDDNWKLFRTGEQVASGTIN
jgi:hypothetical protein